MEVTIDIPIRKLDLEKFKNMSWESKNYDIVKNSQGVTFKDSEFYYGIYQGAFLARLVKLGILYTNVDQSNQEDDYYFTEIGKSLHMYLFVEDKFKQLNLKQ